MSRLSACVHMRDGENKTAFSHFSKKMWVILDHAQLFIVCVLCRLLGQIKRIGKEVKIKTSNCELKFIRKNKIYESQIVRYKVSIIKIKVVITRWSHIYETVTAVRNCRNWDMKIQIWAIKLQLWDKDYYEKRHNVDSRNWDKVSFLWYTAAIMRYEDNY